MNFLGNELFSWELGRPSKIVGVIVPALAYEAGDLLITLDSTLGEPTWLTPGETYSTATYPDAATVFGDDGGTFTVDTYTVPSGYYAYVYSGV